MDENPNAGSGGAFEANFSKAFDTSENNQSPAQIQHPQTVFAARFPILATHYFREIRANNSEATR